jgi:hypothetical protein
LPAPMKLMNWSKSFSLLTVLFLGLAVLAPRALAADGGFTATLSAEQQTAAGLTRLSADEQTALNTLVAREVTLARQGGVKAFAGTFLSRRKPAELTAAGLDRLTPAEQDKLNETVAVAIAAGPANSEPREWKKSELASDKPRVQVHGGVSLTYGWGGGGSYRAGSVYTDIYDPETGVALSLGLSEASGSGLWFRGEPSLYDYYGLNRGVPYLGGGFGGGGCSRRH